MAEAPPNQDGLTRDKLRNVGRFFVPQEPSQGNETLKVDSVHEQDGTRALMGWSLMGELKGPGYLRSLCLHDFSQVFLH